MILDAKERSQLRRLQILASKVLKGELRGEREFRRQGPGSGFREHRAYAEGDALRRVDWNVFGRTGDLVVKEFDAEEALDVVVVQDRSRSMEGAAATTAAKICAGLGVMALSHSDRVRWVPAAGAASRTAESFSGRARIVDYLEAIDSVSGGETDLMAAVRAGLPAHGRAGVAFVVSDFFDPRGATHALRYLLHRRYRVRVILVEDAERLRPPAEGRTRLVDAETGATLVVDVGPQLIASYERALRSRIQGLHGFCRRHSVGFLRVRADTPFHRVVRDALAKGWLTP